MIYVEISFLYVELANYSSALSSDQGLYEIFPIENRKIIGLENMEWMRENGVNGLTKFLR